MLIRERSGVYRPQTTEEREGALMNLLSIPQTKIDYVSSVSQVVSPRQPQVLHSLAEIIRDSAETYVQTSIPHDLVIQPERATNSYPHLQASFNVELGYAYGILSKTEKIQARREQYNQGFLKLEEDIVQTIGKEKHMFFGASSLWLMRTASLGYFGAAWQFFRTGNKQDQAVETFLETAFKCYKHLEDLIAIHQTDQFKKIKKMLQVDGANGISAFAHGLTEEAPNYPNIKFDRWSMEEYASLVYLDHFNALHQDVLLGQMKCYSLQGNYKAFKTSAEELEEFIRNPENQPAPIITASAKVMEQDALKNKRWFGRCHPFISDNPPIVLEAAEKIIKEYGKAPPLVWMPGDKMPQVPRVL